MWRILALRVSFPAEDPDDETTSGRGTFDLRPFHEVRDSLRFPYDAPPHDRAYFQAHLSALSNYYGTVSQGHIQVEYEVYPRDPQASYQLDTPLKEYGNGRTGQEIAQRQTSLFRDAILAAGSAEGANLQMADFQAYAVFHAGLGGEAGAQALNDIPSAYISLADLERHAEGPIPVDGGAHAVTGGMLLPEAISTDGRGGLNGTLARFFANQLGLPGLSNFEDGLPAVGDWSLMDTGNINALSAARLGLQSLTANPADTLLVGFIPSGMTAWSRIRLGWLAPQVVTHNDTVQIIAPHVQADLPQAVRIPISADEYFLLENRISRLTLQDRVPEIRFSRDDSSGVWLSVDDYDAFIPGSGLLVWHVDDAVIRASDNDNPINSNPKFRIATSGITSLYRRGISLEEADGLEDIGNVSASRVVHNGFISLSTIEGGPLDPFYVGNAVQFGPDTRPGSTSNLGYPTGITIEVLSPPGDTVTVAIAFGGTQANWPVTGLDAAGLQAPRAMDLNGDGRKEILWGQGNTHGAWNLEGTPTGALTFSTLLATAVGDLVPGGTEELIFGDASGPAMWAGGQFELPAVGNPDRQGAVVSAPPLIGPFAGGALTDVWGWSDGRIEWGLFAGQQGAAQIGSGSFSALALGNFDADPSNELAVLTWSNELYAVEDSGEIHRIADLGDPAVGGPAVADLDHDGTDEIVIVDTQGAASVYNLDGLLWQSLSVPGGAGSAPVLADLDADGFVEILFGGHGRLWAVRFNGVAQADAALAFPLKDDAGLIQAPPVVADLDADGIPEILVGSTGGIVYGLSADGSPLAGFPFTALGPVGVSPLVDDLDSDGHLELAVFTRTGDLHLWRLGDTVSAVPGGRVLWGQAGGGPGNTGRLLGVPDGSPPAQTAELLPPRRVYCYPNPVRGPRAHIRFYLGSAAQVGVTVLNALGEVVERLAMQNPVPLTDNEILWDTSNYASGLYICRVEATTADRSEVRFVKAAVIR